MSGWIKLHRRLAENPLWFSEPFTRGQAWVDLILLANHEDGFFYLRDHKVNVLRGQVGWSLLKLSLRWKWSRSKTKKFLNDLEKEQQVKQLQSHSTSVFTIINYEKYQEKEQLDEQQKDNRKTTERQQKDTNKNDKNDKNDKKEEFNTPSDPPQHDFTQQNFDTFWKLYPKKAAKQDAFKAFKKIKPSPELFLQIIESINKHLPVWATKEKQYIPNAATWLNGKRWEDEVVQPLFSNKTKYSTPTSQELAESEERLNRGLEVDQRYFNKLDEHKRMLDSGEIDKTEYTRLNGIALDEHERGVL